MSRQGSLDKLKVVLSLWTSLATNTRMRDRGVKVLQYGCQMLIGYYGSKMSPSSLQAFSALRRMSSNSRKAFWLLKSLNHVGCIITALESGIRDKSLPDQLDFLEQIFLVFYYWYESEIYFARAGMLGLDEDVLDPWCNWTWLGGDVAFFLAGLLRLHTHVKRRNELAQRLEALIIRDGDKVDGGICTILCSSSTSLTSSDSRSPPPALPSSSSSQSTAQSSSQPRNKITYSISQLKNGFHNTGNGADVQVHLSEQPLSQAADEKLSLLRELQEMDNATFDKQLSVWIGILELGVSLHYVNFFKFLFREGISETWVGAMGVASSTLILYEGLLKARRELPSS